MDEEGTGYWNRPDAWSAPGVGLCGLYMRRGSTVGLSQSSDGLLRNISSSGLPCLSILTHNAQFTLDTRCIRRCLSPSLSRFQTTSSARCYNAQQNKKLFIGARRRIALRKYVGCVRGKGFGGSWRPPLSRPRWGKKRAPSGIRIAM